MLKSLSKVFVVVAMLVAFIGQALAYTTMSCEMPSDAHQSHMTMEHSSFTAHAGMDHSDMQMQSSNSEDCCETDCHCPKSACSTVTFVNANNALSDAIAFNEAVESHTTEQTNSIPASLYRPPIFA
ncbi:hypothetical protein [Thalassotalea sp. G2M2-11]|uniref:hypothetical protein n=1 Tax=Thalassotalea sp. G2M2-11 TaxID=2787627 RepID=UPI0019D129B6|nr:hypothetical protein [Thalassotalea sp. G2M2-11]